MPRDEAIGRGDREEEIGEGRKKEMGEDEGEEGAERGNDKREEG